MRVGDVTFTSSRSTPRALAISRTISMSKPTTSFFSSM
jgi:hypothetical protein